MYKSKDFQFKRVYNLKNRKLGIVQDLYIDRENGKICGFEIFSLKLSKKKTYLPCENIKKIGEYIIAEKLESEKKLGFSNIKGNEIINKKRIIIGELEDVIIDGDLNIKGIIYSSGVINRLIKGRNVILYSNIEFQNEKIIYDDNKKIFMINIPRRCDGYEFH